MSATEKGLASRIDFFARGNDQALWHNWQVASSKSGWSGWTSLGGAIHSPVVARNADGRLEVLLLVQIMHSGIFGN
ncbi:hypothetical protein [Brevibacillus laterosporus]|uniref:hypothetical protein n=1 Tax=Brevibacillus laterosporus TaxID=1465 RepID=UPI003D250D04